MEFEDYFDWQILDRGLDYFQRDRVKNFQNINNRITAQVQGTYLYHVSLELDENGELEPDSCECDCPYSSDYSFCKHVAAVLYKYEEESKPTFQKTKVTPEELKERLLNSSTDELVRIIMHYTEIRTLDPNDVAFVLHPSISDAEIAKQKKLIEYYLKEADDEYFNNNTYRHLIRDLTKYLDGYIKPLLPYNLPTELFTLLSYLLDTLSTYEIADKYDFKEIVSYAVELIEKITATIDDEKEKEKIFDWVMKNIRYNYYKFKKELLPFFYSSFLETPFQLRKLLYIDNALKEYQKYPAIYSINGSFEECLYLKYQILLSLKSPKFEQFARDNLKYPLIRLHFIDYLISMNKEDEALNLLNDSLILKSDDKTLKLLLAKKAEVQIKKNDMEGFEETIATLMDLPDASIDAIYKAYSNIVTLPLQRLRFLGYALKNKHALGHIYILEKRFDLLFSLVKKSQDIDLLASFEEELKPIYSIELLDEYLSLLNELIQTIPQEKSAYKMLEEKLTYIARFPTGDKLLIKLLQSWKKLYPHNPLLNQMLKKYPGVKEPPLVNLKKGKLKK